MRCPTCATDNKPEARFCRSCGTSLTASPAGIVHGVTSAEMDTGLTCTACGHLNKVSARFCAKCGAELSVEPVAAPAAAGVTSETAAAEISAALRRPARGPDPLAGLAAAPKPAAPWEIQSAGAATPSSRLPLYGVLVLGGGAIALAVWLFMSSRGSEATPALVSPSSEVVPAPASSAAPVAPEPAPEPAPVPVAEPREPIETIEPASPAAAAPGSLPSVPGPSADALRMPSPETGAEAAAVPATAPPEGQPAAAAADPVPAAAPAPVASPAPARPAPPPASSRPAPAPAPARAAAPAPRPAPAPAPEPVAPAPAMIEPAPAPAPAPAIPAWYAALKADMAECATRGFLGRLSCEQVAQWRHCQPGNQWGKVPECPPTAPLPTGQ